MTAPLGRLMPLQAAHRSGYNPPGQPVGQGGQGIRARHRLYEVPTQNRADKFAVDLASGDS